MVRNGALSRNRSLLCLDGRRREAKLLKSLADQRTGLAGGRPTVAQQTLIDQASRLQYRLMLEAEAGKDDPAQFKAWNDVLREMLRDIGPGSEPQTTQPHREVAA